MSILHFQRRLNSSQRNTISRLRSQQTNEQKKQHHFAKASMPLQILRNLSFQKCSQKVKMEKISGWLISERGFTAESIDRFHLGYSPDQWDAFTKAALDAGFQDGFLVSSGLTIKKEKNSLIVLKGESCFQFTVCPAV